MKKILFVDHQFHKKTRSADFFTEILDSRFEVKTYYLLPEAAADTGVLTAAAQSDIIVLWQIDFLAPVFLAMGKPVIVIPMFDGSGGMPDLHWLFAHRARFCNFSLVLNERIRMAHGETMLLRYFPKPVEEAQLPRFDRYNAFFWQRRPDHGVDFQLIDTLLGDELDTLHVHDAADIPGKYSPEPRPDARYSYSSSTWFKHKADYMRCIERANIFIAPRVAEGIGMALLEAMAQGKLVLAHDAPTNSEYVSNWCNGILFNKDCPSPIAIRDKASQMAKMAWSTVVAGHEQWLASHPAIVDWIDGAPPGPLLAIDHADLFRDLWSAYYASGEEYLSFLMRKLELLSQLSGLPFEKLLDVVGEADQSPILAQATLHDCELEENGLLDLTHEDDRFVGEGWSAAEDDWRWAVGRHSRLYFSGLKIAHGMVKAQFTASSLPKLGKAVHCTILINEALVFDGKVTPGWSDYQFTFDANLLKAQNEVILRFDKATSLPTDSRVLSVCFKKFEFIPE